MLRLNQLSKKDFLEFLLGGPLIVKTNKHTNILINLNKSRQIIQMFYYFRTFHPYNPFLLKV